jgi:hypothetical protein
VPDSFHPRQIKTTATAQQIAGSALAPLAPDQVSIVVCGGDAPGLAVLAAAWALNFPTSFASFPPQLVFPACFPSFFPQLFSPASVTPGTGTVARQTTYPGT